MTDGGTEIARSAGSIVQSGIICWKVSVVADDIGDDDDVCLDGSETCTDVCEDGGT